MPPPHPASDSNDEDLYGPDVPMSEELSSVLLTAESLDSQRDGRESSAVPDVDMEDLVTDVKALSPFERFRRKKGYLSVTDLVGTVWCEVQVGQAAQRALWVLMAV